LLFVADGSQEIGAGHHIRCAALAAAALAQRHDVRMTCRDLPDSTHGWAWNHLPVATVAADVGPAALLRSARERWSADLTIVDHHGIASADLATLSAEAPLALIDDLADRDCTGARLVINHAAGIVPADYPRNPVAVGLAWALLRPAFWQRPAVAREHDLALLLVGATDHLGLLPALVQRLLSDPARRLLVISSRQPGSEAHRLSALVAAHPERIDWRRGADAAGVADAMARASHGIVAASTVALEAMAMGLPIVAVHTVANQDRFAAALAVAGVTVVRPDRLDDPAALLANAQVPAGLHVDGRGAERAVARLADCLVPSPLLRQAVWSDADLLLDWLNDPATRQAGFLSAQVVARADHLAWLTRRLPDPDCRLFIAADSDGPLGTMRLDRLATDPLTGVAADHLAVVSITVAPARRGQGAGGRMLAALATWTRASGFARRLRAWVRADNPASLRLFASAGYCEVGAEPVHGQAARRCELELAP